MDFILKGNIYYAKSKFSLEIHENSYLICVNGKSLGVFDAIPDKYKDLKVFDYTDKSILPGLVDLHIHAPQYAFRALGLDNRLIEWLNLQVYTEESKFSDLKYAEKAYSYFVASLKRSATTRACIFATAHKEATLLLMNMLEQAGLSAYVGKINMDRNAPPELMEKSSDYSANETVAWIEQCGHLNAVKPILTPRFIPSCTDDLLYKLRDIFEKYGLPLQSHLSENTKEIEWVSELCPEAKFYGDAYNRFKLFGNDIPTIMAHCVHSSHAEVELLKKNKVFVAHCPQSNTNLSSGIAPIKHYLNQGLLVGLGSDVAGGSSVSIFRAMVDAIQVSKLRNILVDSSVQALTVQEAFYLGTKGGGSFFGNVGSFEAGYEFDAIVLDDEKKLHPQALTPYQRLERILYLSEDKYIIAKFVRGNKLF